MAVILTNDLFFFLQNESKILSKFRYTGCLSTKGIGYSN